jgi:hypothetical protein
MSEAWTPQWGAPERAARELGAREEVGDEEAFTGRPSRSKP